MDGKIRNQLSTEIKLENDTHEDISKIKEQNVIKMYNNFIILMNQYINIIYRL